MKAAVTRPEVIRIDKTKLINIDYGNEFEWIVTNGLGGSSSGTATGLNTRRYHALLTAALNPPVQRTVMVNSLDESVETNNSRFDLSVHQYPGTLHPNGNERLDRFEYEFNPVFHYKIGDVELTKEIWMERGKNITYVSYSLSGRSGSVVLRVRPMLNMRDYHSLQKSWNGGSGLIPVHNEKRALLVKPWGGNSAYWVGWSHGSFVSGPQWFYNVEYLRELARGLDFKEDIYNPGYIDAEIKAGESLVFILSAEAHQPDINLLDEGKKSLSRYKQRKLELLDNVEEVYNDAHARLVIAADDFIVKRKSTASMSVIAGYPWFSDWGRDSMISLPGLAVSTGRFADAKSIIRTFGQYMDRGMLPNRFPDSGESPEYNTVDATLWFFITVYKYFLATGDETLIKEIFPKLEEAISFHTNGTRYGIGTDEDGMLKAGEPGIQLTWMDAKVGDWVVTPRQGKAVEINALWINALFVYRELSKVAGKKPKLKYSLKKLAEKFVSLFWNSGQSCLYDLINENGKDPSIRPNQIFAVSLPYKLLDREKGKAMLATVEKNLLTDWGLRTLSPASPDYRRHYNGDVWQRDSAYHQGTVWPWLLAPYLSAYRWAHGNSEGVKAGIEKKLDKFLSHIPSAGIGHISEVFDAEKPFEPGGCFAQAWSIATTLELMEEMRGKNR